MAAEDSANFFMMDVEPNIVGYSGRKPNNPSDLLFEVYAERGYPFEFTRNPHQSDLRAALDAVDGEDSFAVFCYDADAQANFKLREAVVLQTPDYRFLYLAASTRHSDIELVEKVVSRDLTGL